MIRIVIYTALITAVVLWAPLLAVIGGLIFIILNRKDIFT